MYLGDKTTDGKLNGLDVDKLLGNLDLGDYSLSGLGDLTQGRNPADVITETTSPMSFNFSGDSGRDIHTKTVVTIENTTTASATETITVSLYDGVDTTGTLVTEEALSVTVAANSTTTQTFISREKKLDNGTYHIEISQSGTTLNVTQTDERTKGAKYTLGQDNTGDFYLRDQDGVEHLRVNSVGSIDLGNDLNMGSSNQIRSSASELNDALIDANLDSSTTTGDWFHVIEFDDAGGADDIAWARHATSGYAWYVHNQTDSNWLARVTDSGKLEIPNGGGYLNGNVDVSGYLWTNNLSNSGIWFKTQHEGDTANHRIGIGAIQDTSVGSGNESIGIWHDNQAPKAFSNAGDPSVRIRHAGEAWFASDVHVNASGNGAGSLTGGNRVMSTANLQTYTASSGTDVGKAGTGWTNLLTKDISVGTGDILVISAYVVGEGDGGSQEEDIRARITAAGTEVARGGGTPKSSTPVSNQDITGIYTVGTGSSTFTINVDFSQHPGSDTSSKTYARYYEMQILHFKL